MKSILTFVLSSYAILSLSAPGLRALDTVGPERAVLSDYTMARIVGGVGAAQVGVPFPQNFVSAESGSLKWNQPGNRCQFACTQGATDLGFQASTIAFIVSGVATAPKLGLYADGVKRAETTGTFNQNAGAFDLYLASLVTKCVGGTNDNQLCVNDGSCRIGLPSAGDCRACDQNNVCNTPGQATAPCVAGSVKAHAQTCYLFSECGTGTGGNCIHGDGTQNPVDCTTNGVTAAGTSSNPTASGPMHSVIAKVTTVANSQTFTIGQLERVIKFVAANSTSSPTNCEGTDEVGH